MVRVWGASHRLRSQKDKFFSILLGHTMPHLRNYGETSTSQGLWDRLGRGREKEGGGEGVWGANHRLRSQKDKFFGILLGHTMPHFRNYGEIGASQRLWDRLGGGWGVRVWGARHRLRSQKDK